MDEVLTIKEVAALLKLAEKTVYSMANTGELPAFKIRGQWRIRKLKLDQWMDAQPRGAADDAVKPLVARTQPKPARRGSSR